MPKRTHQVFKTFTAEEDCEETSTQLCGACRALASEPSDSGDSETQRASVQSRDLPPLARSLAGLGEESAQQLCDTSRPAIVWRRTHASTTGEFSDEELKELATDPYGNYVLQTAIKMSKVSFAAFYLCLYYFSHTIQLSII